MNPKYATSQSSVKTSQNKSVAITEAAPSNDVTQYLLPAIISRFFYRLNFPNQMSNNFSTATRLQRFYFV